MEPRARARYEATSVANPPRTAVDIAACLPLPVAVAAETPVVSAPRSTCNPMAMFSAHPVALAFPAYLSLSRRACFSVGSSRSATEWLGRSSFSGTTWSRSSERGVEYCVSAVLARPEGMGRGGVSSRRRLDSPPGDCGTGGRGAYSPDDALKCLSSVRGDPIEEGYLSNVSDERVRRRRPSSGLLGGARLRVSRGRTSGEDTGKGCSWVTSESERPLSPCDGTCGG